MVQVMGSKGAMVGVEMLGVAETARRIRNLGKDISDGLDMEVFRNATFVGEEVQESVIGNRAEPKSVETGTFGNNITVDKIRNAEYRVFTRKKKYQKSNVTADEVATFMEYGTSRGIAPRRHFGNTQIRTKSKVRGNIQTFVQKKVRKF